MKAAMNTAPPIAIPTSAGVEIEGWEGTRDEEGSVDGEDSASAVSAGCWVNAKDVSGLGSGVGVSRGVEIRIAGSELDGLVVEVGVIGNNESEIESVVTIDTGSAILEDGADKNASVIEDAAGVGWIGGYSLINIF
jgi:hypothetical protein